MFMKGKNNEEVASVLDVRIMLVAQLFSLTRWHLRWIGICFLGSLTACIREWKQDICSNAWKLGAFELRFSSAAMEWIP